MQNLLHLVLSDWDTGSSSDTTNPEIVLKPKIILFCWYLDNLINLQPESASQLKVSGISTGRSAGWIKIEWMVDKFPVCYSETYNSILEKQVFSESSILFTGLEIKSGLKSGFVFVHGNEDLPWCWEIFCLRSWKLHVNADWLCSEAGLNQVFGNAFQNLERFWRKLNLAC